MERVDKIALLKGIQFGKISIADIFPKQLSQRIGNNPETYKIDATYVSKELYEIEYKRQIKLFGTMKITVAHEDYDPYLN